MKTSFPPFSLWLRSGLIGGAVILAAFLGFGSHAAFQQEKILEQGVIDITRTVAQNISAAVVDDVLEQRIERIDALLLRQLAVKPVLEVMVTDKNGKMLSHVRRPASGSENGGAPLPYRPVADLFLQGYFSEVLSAQQYRYTLQMTRGTRVGLVMVSADLSALAASRQQIYLDTLRAALLATIVVLLLLNLSGWRHIPALERAIRFARLVSTQPGAQIAPDSRLAEINTLLQALNTMSGQLAQQQELLQYNQAYHQALMQLHPDCLLTLNETGHILEISAAAEKCFVCSQAQAQGMLLDEFMLSPASRNAHRNGQARFFGNTQSGTWGQLLELNATRRNRQEFPAQLAFMPFRCNGRSYFCGYLRDISAKQALLAESAARHEASLQMMRELEYQKFALDQHAIVSMCDGSGKIISCNQKLSDISGYSSAKLQQHGYPLLHSGVQPPAFYREIWQTIGSGKVWHGQIANRRADGAIFWLATTIVPWLDAQGAPGQYMAIQTDITEQKAMEQTLEQWRQRELETGYQIQQALLWDTPPENLGHTLIATHSEASQGVDGDFFGFTRFSATSFDILIGDVMGKGIPAAMTGAAVKTAYQQVLTQLLAQRCLAGARQSEADATDATSIGLPDPAEIINAMHQQLTPRLIPLNCFVTLALYRVDLQQQRLSYVNAGHTPGLLADAKSETPQQLQGENLPLGVLLEEIYQQHSVPLAPGQSLLAYSDGMIEIRNARREEFGLAQLSQSFAQSQCAHLPPSQTLLRMRRDLHHFSGHNRLMDDQTAVLVNFPDHFTGIPQAARAMTQETFELRWELKSLGLLRSRISALANALAMSASKRDALLLAAFESASNIIRHCVRQFADSTISCRLTPSNNALEVELIYVSNVFMPARPPEADFNADSNGGFGLFIIEKSVDRVLYGTPLAGVGSIHLIQSLHNKKRKKHFSDCLQK